MQKNYKELLNKVKQRTNPDNIPNKRALLEGAGIKYSDINEYVKLAMIGVPPEYTLDSKTAAKQVISHLERSHGNEVEFKLQGSIETNTHILKDNDIDLVQISTKSTTFDREGLREALEKPYAYTATEYKNLKKHSDDFSVYIGNQLSDLGKLRLKSEDVLTNTYKHVNISKPKAICVKVTNPLRNVDVVTAVRYNPVFYMKSNKDYRQGIQVYNKDTDSKLPPEYPFWSIKRINEKSILSNGRLKKMIRFMKNIKHDSSLIIGKPNISSFDINTICFDIELGLYDSLNYLDLVGVIYNQICKLLDDVNYRNNLLSVDGQEFIFRNNQEKVNELKIFKIEIDSILKDIQIEKIFA